MFTKHVSRRLAAYLDGELPTPGVREVEAHLDRCRACRAEREQVQLGIESLDYLPRAAAPDSIWLAIEAALDRPRTRHARPAAPWRLAFAAAAVLLLIATAWWMVARRAQTRWAVTRLAGTTVSDIGAGEWISTDAVSRARVRVGTIGSVEVEPNTRLRLVAARPDEHRFELARGSIHATITAPPRLFFVNTAAGTAVDLGCEYTLSTDDDGAGILRVTRGWVAFEWKGLESLVPAGAICRTRPQAGPGVPYFEDAPVELQQALEGKGPLDVILDTARVRDTLTLWHLLQRLDPVDRARVYDRIAVLTPVPAGVSRDRALALDPETLKRWKDELAWTW
jgi:hypothetical protein